MWWLLLRNPSGKHLFWLGEAYDNETGFESTIQAALAIHPVPENWIDLRDNGEPYERSLHDGPVHPDLLDGAVVHEQGWLDSDSGGGEG